MKRIITLLLVAVMMCTAAFSASAAVSEGVNVLYSEDANGVVTVTVSVVGVSNLTSVKAVIKFDNTALTLLGKDKAAYTAGSDKAANYDAVVASESAKFATNSWASKQVSLNTAKDQITVSRGRGGNNPGVDCTTSEDVLVFYFQKAEGVTLSSDIIYLNTNTMSGATYEVNGTVQRYNASKFDEEYDPYKAPAATVWTNEAPADLTEWNNAFKFKGVDGNDATDYAGKKLVIFGKGTPAGSLKAGGYSVKIGDNEYVGQIDATEYWAIVILDENGKKVAKDSYNYEAYVGEEKVFGGVVNAQ